MIITQLVHADVVKKLPTRARDAHKGDFGHVVVLGGDEGMSGACRLAAEAALRVGAGKVTVGTRAVHAFMVNMTRPELMSRAVEDETTLKSLMNSATVIVVGPGLGQSAWSKMIWDAVMREQQKLMVVDADALRLLAKNPVSKDNWVLTPHPGEAAELLDTSVLDIQANRTSAAQDLSSKYQGVVVLKGARSVIAGMSDNLCECTAGNPAMATAGMGDVLAGVIGGLLSQHMTLRAAAELGVMAHAMAGDVAASGRERGLLAADLLAYLPDYV